MQSSELLVSSTKTGNYARWAFSALFATPTVGDSFAPGIGKRLDGWANRDLNVGLIVSLAPDLKPLTDLFGVDAGTVIPPAFGLAGVNLHTWTGFGSVPYWNSYVAATELNGSGTFFDARLSN